MRLLVSGCSFSAGATVTHVEGGETHEDLYCAKKHEGFLWPNLIADANDYELHNISIPGNSNDKIIRLAIEWLDKHGINDTVVVIQFSSFYRLELYNEIFDQFINYCTNGELVRENGRQLFVDADILYDAHCDHFVLQDKLDNHKLHHKTLQATTNMLKYAWNKENLQIDFLQKVLFLQSYLKDRGVPYLFTSMATGTNPLYMASDVSGTKVDYIRLLRNMIDFDSWAPPLTRFSGNNIFDDGHPNEKGKQLIAANIQENLDKLLSR